MQCQACHHGSQGAAGNVSWLPSAGGGDIGHAIIDTTSIHHISLVITDINKQKAFQITITPSQYIQLLP